MPTSAVASFNVVTEFALFNLLQGQPVLSFIDDCNYHFDWDTSVICPPHECTFIPDTCEMVQNDLNMRYNFKNASFTKDGKIAVSFSLNTEYVRSS